MTTNTPLTFRPATEADLPALVAMLADDVLGREREDAADPTGPAYRAAFRAIDDDPGQELLVACAGDEVVAMLQVTYTPSLSYRGSWRATLESVRTASDRRGQGIGAALVEHADERARSRGCLLVQLTTDATRVDAHRFYERLGFTASHVGMKKRLEPATARRPA